MAPPVALIRASHPIPCLVITAITVAVAARAGAGLARLVALTVVVLAGQFSIGWSNDGLDLPRDRAANRTGKPLVAGTVAPTAVWISAGVAAAGSLVGGFLIGVWPGIGNALLMAPAWAYNAGLKATAWSGVMYVLGFAPIPALAASTAGQPVNWWLVTAAGVIGLGGHFSNVLPDLSADQATGVRGLPQQVAARFGISAARYAAVVLLVAASLLIVLPAGTGWFGAVGLAAVAALAVAGVRARGRTPFYSALAIAGLDVVLFVALA